MEQQGKVCSKCGVWKPLEEYHKHKSRKDGRRAKCKECRSKEAKQYAERNKEKIALRNKEWYEENKEKISLKHKEWYKENKEKDLLRGKKYRENNKEKIAQRHKKYREEHREELAEKSKKYRRENKEKIKKYSQQWYEKNKDKEKENHKEWYEKNKEKIHLKGKREREENKQNNLKAIKKVLRKINLILEELPIYGTIYAFKNVKTEKMYIGQTIQPLIERYHGNIIKEWIKERKERVNQKYLEELNEEDFEVIEILDVACCKYHLDKLEVYYIDKYNSFLNGYNNTPGNYATNDGLKEFNEILKEYNLEFAKGKIARK